MNMEMENPPPPHTHILKKATCSHEKIQYKYLNMFDALIEVGQTELDCCKRQVCNLLHAMIFHSGDEIDMNKHAPSNKKKEESKDVLLYREIEQCK
jgi:hypothetical protein